MQPSFKDFSYCMPSDFSLDAIASSKPFEPFADSVIDLLDAWSKAILRDKESRLYPDAVTFAFWIRKSNLLAMKAEYKEGSLRLGRGVTFHIAPGNVPINFAYSFVAGILAGNAAVVRISSKPFRQVDILCSKMDELLSADFADLKGHVLFVQYDRTRKDLTDCLSEIADTRLVWGGDRTIEEIRKSPLPPRSNEICFADRYSLAVVNADEVIANKDNLNQLAYGFYNDTYLFDQNACTAPHLIVWTGKMKEDAKKLFWDAVYKYSKTRYTFPAVTAVDKLTAFCKEAVELGSVARRISTDDNLVTRVQLFSLPENIEDYRSIGGYFNEIDVSSINELAPAVKRKYQTLSYFGEDKDDLLDFVRRNRLVGIDRIVPIGKTMDFNLIWDGYDLIGQMSREVYTI